jgi:hypothetical protein
MAGRPMIYSEMVYFDGAHFAHIVDYKEHVRLGRIRENIAKRSVAGEDVGLQLSGKLNTSAVR